MDKLLNQGRTLLDASQPEECISLLIPEAERLPNEVPLLQLLGEAYIEFGDPQNAYILFLKSAELDPTGEKAGYEKFLWLGQLCGDREGLDWFEQGLEGMRKELANLMNNDKRASAVRKKLCESICSMIEIWMTDLQEEEEAEKSCDKLITEALLVDDSIPDNWVMLGSVRIQQQKYDEAKTALSKAWSFFESGSSGSADELSTLVSLAQCLMEVSLFDEVLDVTQLIHRIDDHIPNAYYINGLAHYNIHEEEREKPDQDSKKLLRHGVGAIEAFTHLIQHSDEMDVPQDMVESVKEAIGQLPSYDVENYEDSEDEVDEEVKNLED